MKDCNGVEIQTGDRVVVAGRQGSSQWLTTTEVVGQAERCGVTRPVLQGEERTHTYRKPVGEGLRQTERTKPYRRNYPYLGSQRAIMVIPKGPEITFNKIDATDTTDHDLGDEHRSMAR